MSKWLAIAMAAVLFWSVQPVSAQDDDALEKLQDRVEELESRLNGLGGGSDPAEGDDEFFIPREAATAHASDRDEYFGGLYTKPFLYGNRNVYLGGYIDLEFGDAEDDIGTFDPHRLVPFIYADVSDRVKIALEIEIEHGNELGIEFGVIDYMLSDALNFRAGILLSPVSRYNMLHDSPIQDLTDSPLLAKWVVPAVDRQSGAGIFGGWAGEGEDEWSFDYELYLATGYKGLLDNGTNVITQGSGLRNARAKSGAGGGGAYRDNNDNVAVMGRAIWSPHAGVEAGFGFLNGTYDERNDNNLTIMDFNVVLAGNGMTRHFGGDSWIMENILEPAEWVFEWARADLDADAFAETAGVADDLSAFYFQWNQHIFADFLKSWEEEGWVGEGAHFTLVYRYDGSDLDGAERSRNTFGINFRPNTSKTVVKLSYATIDESGDAVDVDNDEWWFSIASYF